MKKKKWLLLILVAALAGGAVYWRSKKIAKNNKKNTPTVVTVTQGAIEESIEATGEVTPFNRVEIKPPVSGRIEQLLVEEGSSAKSGEVLAWMSSSDRAAILDAARAKGPEEWKKWQDTYKPTPIMAPLSGVIILKNIVVGQTVDASTILFAMSDRLIVTAQVDEADIGHIKNNMPARITLDAYPDQPIDGHVTKILYEGKNVSNVITYGVKIAPDKVPPYFRSQMTANVAMILQRREDTLLLPAQAVQGPTDGKFVLVPPTEGKQPVRTPVETGLQSGGQIEILSGLEEGAKVLISGAKYTPQKGPQSSPLALGGSRNQSGQQQQGSGQRQRQQ